MPLWGGTDVSGNSAIFAPAQINLTPNTSNRDALFANTSLINGKVVGMYGMTITEKVGANSAVAAPGWVLKTQGTGYVSSLNISAGGTAYNNTDIITVQSYTGGINAIASLTTNSTGGIIGTTLTNLGAGIVNVNSTALITNSSGGATSGNSAVIDVYFGGRAGRTTFETLAAVSTLS